MVNTKYYRPDSRPDCEGFTYVSYRNPKWETQTREDRKQRALAEKRRLWRQSERERDPMYVHRMQQREHEEFWSRRLERDPRYRDCDRVPIPSFPHQNWEPVMVDNRKRDENGDVIGARRRRPPGANRRERQGNRSRHQKTQAQQAQVERQADEGSFKRRLFDRAFVERVKNARINKKMKQDDVAMLVNCTLKEIQQFEKGEMEFDAGFKSQLIWRLDMSKGDSEN